MSPESPLLEVHELVLRHAPPNIKPITFTLQSGARLFLQGPSGSGKTSLFRTLVRLNAPRSGSIILQGESSADVPAPAWRKRIAYLPQQPVLFTGTVQDNLNAPFHPIPRRRLSQQSVDHIRRLLGALGLNDATLLNRSANNISGGEAARVALVRALLLNPAIVLADEITSQLDDLTRQRVIDALAKFTAAGGGLIIATHQSGAWEQRGNQGNPIPRIIL